MAIVTGGSKGIGRACCELLAENGCRIAVVARGPEELERTVATLRARGAQAIGVCADATEAEQLVHVREQVERRLGPVDVLLPYAGGFHRFSAVWDIPVEEWEEVLRGNLTATFLALREFLPGMIERGSGAVVVMASISARVLDKLTTASYAAAKAGVLMLMRHAAIEAAPHGVRINAIAPATVSSERINTIMDYAARQRTAALSPLGRLGAPEDCAAASVFLASGAAGWMTGVTLDVAGGRAML